MNFSKAILMAAAMACGTAHAGLVFSTSNGTFASPQNIAAASFDLLPNLFVMNALTIPHVEIYQRFRPSSGFDYYEFAHGGGTLHVDIDYFPSPIPTPDFAIFVMSLTGTVLYYNDNHGALDPGSLSINDPALFGITGLAAANYIVGIGTNLTTASTATGSMGTLFGGPLSGGTSYILNISTERSVPEPGSLALVGAALTGLGIARRRKTAAHTAAC